MSFHSLFFYALSAVNVNVFSHDCHPIFICTLEPMGKVQFKCVDSCNVRLRWGWKQCQRAKNPEDSYFKKSWSVRKNIYFFLSSILQSANMHSSYNYMDWLRDFTPHNLNKFVILIPVTSRGIDWGVVILGIGHFSSKTHIPAFLKTSYIRSYTA